MEIKEKVFQEVQQVFTAYLESKELRKTPERYNILEEVYSYQGHFDVDTLFEKLKKKNSQVSRATVYNTLDLLVDCDLVRRHQFDQNQAQFEKSFGYKQHDHLICTECHKVLEFCDPRIQNIQDMVGELLHFKVLHHSLILYGACTNENCENK